MNLNRMRRSLLLTVALAGSLAVVGLPACSDDTVAPRKDSSVDGKAYLEAGPDTMFWKEAGTDGTLKKEAGTDGTPKNEASIKDLPLLDAIADQYAGDITITKDLPIKTDTLKKDGTIKTDGVTDMKTDQPYSPSTMAPGPNDEGWRLPTF